MNEQMKNQNEYKLEDRLYVKHIKKCEVLRKVNNIYQIKCSIHQRGVNYYNTDEYKDYIFKTGLSINDRKKKLWLSDEAKKTISEYIDCFERCITLAKTGGYEEVVVGKDIMTIYYRHSSDVLYDTVIEFTDEDNVLSVECYKDLSIHELRKSLTSIRCYTGDDNERLVSALFDYKEGFTINDDPLVKYAISHDDSLLELQLKLEHNQINKQECLKLSELTGKKILAPYPLNDTLKYSVYKNEIDFELLENSGYHFLHRPSFAMKGYTHKAYDIIPKDRVVVDATGCSESLIHFDEFLQLFNKGDEK